MEGVRFTPCPQRCGVGGNRINARQAQGGGFWLGVVKKLLSVSATLGNSFLKGSRPGHHLSGVPGASAKHGGRAGWV